VPLQVRLQRLVRRPPSRSGIAIDSRPACCALSPQRGETKERGQRALPGGPEDRKLPVNSRFPPFPSLLRSPAVRDTPRLIPRGGDRLP
jgi:hypothetical protein